jgi:hypothetical protein
LRFEIRRILLEDDLKRLEALDKVVFLEGKLPLGAATPAGSPAACWDISDNTRLASSRFPARR